MQKQQTGTLKQAAVMMKHLQGEIAKAKKDAAGKSKQDAQLQTELKEKKRVHDDAQREVDTFTVDETAVQQLEAIVATERAAVAKWGAKRRGVAQSVGNMLDTSFRSPHAQFDRAAVRGLVARLLRVKEARHALSLEVTAGSKLWHLVVNTDQVGAPPPPPSRTLRSRLFSQARGGSTCGMSSAYRCEWCRRRAHRGQLPPAAIHDRAAE